MSFANQDLASLFARRAELEAELSAARSAVEVTLVNKKALLDEVNADIATLGKPLAEAAYKRVDKVSGTIKFASGDVIFKLEIKKNVTWDSAALLNIASELPLVEAQKIFKFEASIGEKVFAAVEDEALKAKLIAARSVKYGDPAISEDK